MSVIMIRRWTIGILATLMLLALPVSGFSAEFIAGGVNTLSTSDGSLTTSDAPLIKPIRNAPPPTSLDIVTPSFEAGSIKAKSVSVKKGGVVAGVPSNLLPINESYRNLTPNASTTPQCPVNFACPDVNNMLDGKRLTSTTIAAQCPDVCQVSREGNLDDGDKPPVCPSGYAQIGMFNVQDEWIPTGSGGAKVGDPSTWEPVPTNDFATFKQYWNDYETYRCTGYLYGHGDWICQKYGKWYDAYWGDMHYTSSGALESWGMLGNGDAPYAHVLNPVKYADAKIAAKIGNPNFTYDTNAEKAMGVHNLFNAVRAANMMPAIWTASSNEGYLISSRWANFYPSGEPSNYNPLTGNTHSAIYDIGKTTSGGYTVPAQCHPEECFSLGGWGRFCMPAYCTEEYYVPETTSYTLNFYSNSSCTAPGGYSCRNSGACYVKVRASVTAHSCKKMKSPKLKPSGYKIPTSLLCGRIKPAWE